MTPPTYAGMSDADRTTRARASLEIARWLDTASIAETIVIGRCTARIDVLRKPQPADECTPDRCSPACPLDQWSALDQALQLELTDVRIERDHIAAQDEDAARDIERDRAGMTSRSANTVAGKPYDEAEEERTRMRMHAGQLDGSR